MKNSLRSPVVWLFLVAWVLRLGAVVVVQYTLDQSGKTWVIAGDAEGYWDLARKLVAGEPYEIYTPPRQVLRMPGFPAILAASIAIFGERLFAARLVLATIGALGCVGVYGLGQRLVNARIGLIAGGLAAVSPVFIGFSAIELTETAFAVAAVFSLIPVADMLDSPSILGATRWRSAILFGLGTGLLAGVSCYLRPSWLLFPPALGLFLWLVRRRLELLVFAGVTCGALVGSLVPWGLRNHEVTGGHFVLTTLWMGPSLYDGWNPDNQNGDSDMRFFDRENVMAAMTEYEMDQHYRQRAWAFAFANPDRVASLALKKAARYWNPFPNADQFARYPALNAMSAIWFLVLMVPAFWGAWQRRRDLALLAVTAGPILYFAALHLVFVSSVRYRLPGEYPLLILTAIGLESFWPNRKLPAMEATTHQPSAGSIPQAQ